MDRQVSKINKSDGRDTFLRTFQEGVSAFLRGIWINQDPYQYRENKKLSQEWRAGWRKEEESYWDYWKKGIDNLHKK